MLFESEDEEKQWGRKAKMTMKGKEKEGRNGVTKGKWTCILYIQYDDIID